jgi:hypothetical protein
MPYFCASHGTFFSPKMALLSFPLPKKNVLVQKFFFAAAKQKNNAIIYACFFLALCDPNIIFAAKKYLPTYTFISVDVSANYQFSSEYYYFLEWFLLSKYWKQKLTER